MEVYVEYYQCPRSGTRIYTDEMLESTHIYRCAACGYEGASGEFSTAPTEDLGFF
jgi:predicted RNA-binding Zn-ribbon protein involved in translation (DUF1610 family)